MKRAAPGLLALFGAVAAASADAQLVTPLWQGATIDPATVATKTDLAAVQAQIPTPAAVVPPSEMVGGSVGTAGTYRPADSANPRITRAGITSTDTQGAWSIAFAAPLMATPVVLPVPVNTGTQPIVCNVATRSATGATGKCWLARTLPAALVSLTSLVSYDLFGAPASGIQVQIIAIPPTQ